MIDDDIKVLLDRLEFAEGLISRMRGQWIHTIHADECLALMERRGAAERNALRASPDVVTRLIDRLEAAERRRDALASLLREARDAITLAGYGSRMAPEVRDTLERIEAAITAQEQSNG